MTKLEKFLKKHKSKSKSELDKFAEEIFELSDQGYSLAVIQEFLNEQGIRTNISNISRWRKRRLKGKQQPRKASTSHPQSSHKPTKQESQLVESADQADAIAKMMKIAEKKHTVESMMAIYSNSDEKKYKK